MVLIRLNCTDPNTVPVISLLQKSTYGDLARTSRILNKKNTNKSRVIGLIEMGCDDQNC